MSHTPIVLRPALIRVQIAEYKLRLKNEFEQSIPDSREIDWLNAAIYIREYQLGRAVYHADMFTYQCVVQAGLLN